jgi:hypothetical protein
MLVCLLCDTLMRVHAFNLVESECSRWFIGRCVVLCVQVGGFVGGGNESKFCGGGWRKFECFGIQKGLCVDFECNRPSFLATVFTGAKFNGELNQWNVATVTNMQESKFIRIVENDLT